MVEIHLAVQVVDLMLPPLREHKADGAYVSEYLSWRSQPLWLRLAGYRHYYVGPELDRLSRCLLWLQ